MTLAHTDTRSTHRAELLLPAGSLEKLHTAILYGADAVYMGTPDMSLRTKSDLTLEEVVAGVEFAHSKGKKVYLTLNLFSHNKDIDKLPHYVETVRKVQPDGLIVADPGVFSFVRSAAPELELHISTQANICSWQSAQFWQELGATLIVLAREVSFAELSEIREKCPDVKLESFIHGSMCMTYSGRCMLSNFMSERGANQGNCANNCRWKYKVHIRLKDGTVEELALTEENLDLFEFLLEEEFRPGELMPIIESERGTTILNSKDLCLMPKLDDLLSIGIDSLKVEGRGKSVFYAGLVARAYRRAIDDWYDDRENWCAEDYLDELTSIPNRGYTLAFHDGRLTNMAHNYETSANLAQYEFAGIIRAVDDTSLVMEVKNRLVAGDVLEFISPLRRDPILLRLYEFVDAKTGEALDVVQGGPKSQIRVPFSLFHLEDMAELPSLFPPYTLVRKEKPLTDSDWYKIKLDKEAAKIEAGGGDADLYHARLDDLQVALDEKDKNARPKTARIGIDGCCAKGCNGCLMFWYDEKFSGARQKLATMKQGERL